MSTPAAPSSILIVDDDPDLLETLIDFFSMENYAVLSAGDTAQAREILAGFEPDLILLDITMPGGDGLSFASELRLQITTPIIFLSGKGSMLDRIVGLEVGADDYLPKPFELRELLARVRAVLRRTRPPTQAHPETPSSTRAARFAGLVVEPVRRLVSTQAGEAIDLTGAEYNLLAAFMERPNRVLSRSMLADLMNKGDWDVFDRSIDTLVSRLRRKLADQGAAHDIIQTVRGEGYVFATEIEWSGAAQA